jgi:nucleoside-diphosphate-sugar epimerase
MQKKNFLIFGGNHFVGQAAVQALLAKTKNTNVQIITITRTGVEPELFEHNSNLISLKADRNNEQELKTALAKFDEFEIVFDITAYQPEHLTIPLQVLKNRVKKWAFVSSAGVYANSDILPLEENSPKVNKMPHLGKLQCEEILKSTENLISFFIRPAYIYGPDNTFEREIFFFKAIEAEKEILIPGNGENLLQFSLAEEIGQNLINLGFLPDSQTLHKAFHIANKNLYSVNYFIKTCGEVVGKEAKLKYFDPNLASQHKLDIRDIFPFRINHYFTDLEPLHNLGLQNKISLKDGLEKTYNWFKQNRNLYTENCIMPAGLELMNYL